MTKLVKVKQCFIFWLLLVSCFDSSIALAKTAVRKATEARPGVRIVYLDDMNVAPITVHPDGVVLNFPSKPEVHIGKKGAFNIVYSENDLIVSALAPGVKTNLFIYLLGRRYTVKLIAGTHGGDEIVSIRDSLDRKLEVEVK